MDLGGMTLWKMSCHVNYLTLLGIKWKRRFLTEDRSKLASGLDYKVKELFPKVGLLCMWAKLIKENGAGKIVSAYPWIMFFC